MKKPLLLTIAAVFFLLVSVSLLYKLRLAQPVSSSEPEAVYPISRVMQYSFTIQNPTNVALDDVVFSTFAPVRQTATQRTDNIWSSHEYQMDLDDSQNQVLRFSFSLAPFEVRVVKVRAEISLSEQSNALKDSGVSSVSYLAGEAGIEVGDSQLVERAAALKQVDSASTAKSVFDWVTGYLTYSGFIAEDRGALYALQAQKGDCTEYAYLYTALSRINHIPTRTVGGFVQETNATFQPGGYHNWVEVYLDGRWHIVDPQKEAFMERQSTYIAMRIISGATGLLSAGSHGIAHATKGARVTMN